MADDELSSEEALKALERFVVENDDLLALEERIGRFNSFDALGIARVFEIPAEEINSNREA